MSGGVARDRLLVLLLGLVLVAAGLLCLDWRYRLVLDGYPDAIGTTAAEDVVTASWWPWALAAVGIVLGLLGLWWALVHLGRDAQATLRTAAGDETGHVEVDLHSVATAAAARLAALGPVTGPSGAVAPRGATTLIELRGHVDPTAEVDALTQAAATCRQDLAAAFPDDTVECRVVLDAPRRARRERSDRVRVD